MKIALIGAGSQSFGRGTITDLLLSQVLNDEPMQIALMDIEPRHLPRPEAFGRKAAERLKRNATVFATTDLDRALDGADFAVSAIEVERFLYWTQDFHTPRKYGFKQIFGENGGPGGAFHALRNMGPMVHIARRMEALCPKATLLNYTNPESKLCEAITRLTSIRTVGLCHGVFMGRAQIAAFLGMKTDELETVACGINHFTWFQTIRHRQTGEDLYPRLRERERQADPLADWDDLALSRACLRIYGLWPSPGANHIGEYMRWAHEMLASPALQYYYDPLDGHPWQTGRVPNFVYSLGHKPTHIPMFPETKPVAATPEPEVLPANAELKPSGELGVSIMESLARGVRNELPAVVVPNRGCVPGLDDESVIEMPAVADGGGLHFKAMAPLPDAVTAMIRTQASIQKLLVEAYAENSRMKLLQALLLDPTVDSYRNAVNLINEMCELQKCILPPMTW